MNFVLACSAARMLQYRDGAPVVCSVLDGTSLVDGIGKASGH